jgi:hypothetical protein
MTKAASGYSLRPHFADVPALLQAEGFERVDILATPEVAALQKWDERDSRLARLLLPGAAFALLERARGRRYRSRYDAARARGLSARFYVYFAA